MPELRKDPITGRWVIISTERGKRPNDFLRESVIAKVPLKVASSAEDIATLVCFLATPASSNMTGELVRMDAGLHLIT